MNNHVADTNNQISQSSGLLKSLFEFDVIPLRVQEKPKKRKKRKRTSSRQNNVGAWQALVRHAEYWKTQADELEELRSKHANREQLTQDEFRRLNYLQQLFDSGGNK